MKPLPPGTSKVETEHADYLRDESRLAGWADAVVFPRSESELRDALAGARRQGRRITIQGGRTGITGGAVPQGGHVVSLTRMNRILSLVLQEDHAILTVEPGLTLSELRQALAEEAPEAPRRWFFPPDPTEPSATLGGMVACNASGALTYCYGAVRDYVERARVMLADGEVLDLRRGVHRAAGRRFTLVTEGGRRLEGELPCLERPRVKNAAGFFVEPDMDMLDLFIGCEGTLGVFTQIALRLIPAPRHVWGLMAFLPSDDQAVEWLEWLRTSGLPVVALEFFDERALDLMRRAKEQTPDWQAAPTLKAQWRSALYAEFHGDDAGTLEMAVARAAESMASCGGREDDAWLATDAAELQRLKEFRHALPELVNRTIDERRRSEPGLTKLGTDFAVPDAQLRTVLKLYREGLSRERLDHVMFGHIGNNHLHVNILPRTIEDYERGKRLVETWAREVVAMGGTVSAEHGIGKLKTGLLRIMYGESGVRQMAALKQGFDPDGLFNPGNLFDRPPEGGERVSE